MPKYGTKRKYEQLKAAVSSVAGGAALMRRWRDGGDKSGPAFGKRAKVSTARDKKKSKTGTKTGHIKSGTVFNEGTGGQCSYFNSMKGKCYLPKHVENALPPLVVQTNSAAQLKSTVAHQAVANVLKLNLPSDCTTYTGDKLTRLLYQKVTADVTMNNIYLSNCYLIIYDIVARRDIGSSNITDPLNTWAQGDADTGGNTNAYMVLGSTPWQTEVFNQYWEVKQVTNVVLASGATHVHKVRLQPNKLISSARATYSPYAFAGLTYYCMIEIHGSPANDTMTQSQVSVGVSGLNIISDQELTFKQIATAKPTLSITNSLATSFTNGEQAVNLGGTLIEAQAEG